MLGNLASGVGSLVGSVAGVAAGVAGTAVGVTGTILGGVADSVTIAGRTVLGFQEDPHTYDPYDESSQTIYEQKAKVDQILAFFETEHEKFVGYFKDAGLVEEQRVAYYNCVNAIEFQNDVIAQLVDEIIAVRSQLRQGAADSEAVGFGSKARAAQEQARRELTVRLAHAKLDLGERRSKRRSKERERQQLAATLSPLISEAKLARLMADQEQQQRETKEDLPSQWSTSARSATVNSRDFDDRKARSSQVEMNLSSNGLARRRYKHYSDEELSALLQEKD